MKTHDSDGSRGQDLQETAGNIVEQLAEGNEHGYSNKCFRVIEQRVIAKGSRVTTGIVINIYETYGEDYQ